MPQLISRTNAVESCDSTSLIHQVLETCLEVGNEDVCSSKKLVIRDTNFINPSY